MRNLKPPSRAGAPNIPGWAKAMAIASLSLAGVILLLCFVAPDTEGFVLIIGLASIGVAATPAVKALSTPRKKALLSSFVAANLAPIWFLYIEGILPGQDARDLLPPEMRMKGYLWAAVYATLYNTAYWICLKTSAKKLARKFPLLVPEPSSLVLAVSGLLCFWVPMVVIGSRYDSLAELWYSLTAGRVSGEGMGVLLRVGAVGGEEAIYQPFMWLFQLAPVVSAMALDRAIRSGRGIGVASFATLFGLAVIFFYFLGGSRGQFIQMLAGPAGILLYRNLNRGWAVWIGATAAFFLLIGLMELQVRARGNMLEKLQDEETLVAESKDGSVTTFNPLESHRDNNMYLACLIFSQVPDLFPYAGYKSFFVDICNPIPRALWPGKPSHHDGDLGAKNVDEVFLAGPSMIGTSSLSTTVVGDFYRMGGALALALIALLYASLHSYLDRVFLLQKNTGTMILGLQAAAFFFAFWGFRAFGTFITMGYPFFILVAYLVIKSRSGNRDDAVARPKPQRA